MARISSSQRHAARDAFALDLAKELARRGKPIPSWAVLQRLAAPHLERAEKKLARSGWIGPKPIPPVRVTQPKRDGMRVLKRYG